MTTRQLAEKLDIVPATVVMYENGKHPIPYDVAIKLADVLEIEASLLYDDFSRFLAVPYTEVLKSVRTALELSQKAFAEQVGIVPSYYYKIEEGNRRPSRNIAAQTRNLREADGSIKKFIQEDLQNLAEELRKTERQLSKLDEGRKNNMIAIRDLEMTKERLLSFAEYAKDAQPEVLVTLIQTIVERIYIVDKDDERYCHIFIKGCSGEDYTGFFRTAGYIEDNSTSVCDSEQCCICRILLLNMI